MREGAGASGRAFLFAEGNTTAVLFADTVWSDACLSAEEAVEGLSVAGGAGCCTRGAVLGAETARLFADAAFPAPPALFFTPGPALSPVPTPPSLPHVAPAASAAGVGSAGSTQDVAGSVGVCTPASPPPGAGSAGRAGSERAASVAAGGGCCSREEGCCCGVGCCAREDCCKVVAFSSVEYSWQAAFRASAASFHAADEVPEAPLDTSGASASASSP